MSPARRKRHRAPPAGQVGPVSDQYAADDRADVADQGDRRHRMRSQPRSRSRKGTSTHCVARARRSRSVTNWLRGTALQLPAGHSGTTGWKWLCHCPTQTKSHTGIFLRLATTATGDTHQPEPTASDNSRRRASRPTYHLPRIRPLIPALTRICCASLTWLIAVPRSWRTASLMWLTP